MEAAWAAEAVGQAVHMARYVGRLVARRRSRRLSMMGSTGMTAMGRGGSQTRPCDSLLPRRKAVIYLEWALQITGR